MTSTGILLVSLAVLVGAVALLLILNRPFRTAVGPNPIRVRLYETVNVEAVVERRTWAWGKWRRVPATFLIRSLTSEVFSVRPDRGATASDSDSFGFEVTGGAPGTASCRISATPGGQARALIAEVPVEVEANDGDRRRIRQSSAALSASIRH